MNKKLWLTSLTQDRAVPASLAGRLKQYGFDVAGGFWEDDLDGMAWMGSREMLIRSDIMGWLIVGGASELASPSIRYGLAALSLTVAAARGKKFPVFIVVTEGALPAAGVLPTSLGESVILQAADPSLFAKVVAKTSVPPGIAATGYRLDIIGEKQVGQWFELGPSIGTWRGTLFGVSGGDIDFQAVGPKEALPASTVLNFPTQGMKLVLEGTEYTAWGVKNEIAAGSSYFARVKGAPNAVVFGEFPETDDAELFSVRLK